MKGYDKFRQMLPAVARILDLSKAAEEEAEAVKNLGFEEEFDGAYTGELFLKMSDEEINNTIEEIFDALEAGGLCYARFKKDTQIGEFFNGGAGFDVIEVVEDGVIAQKISDGSINLFSMMC